MSLDYTKSLTLTRQEFAKWVFYVVQKLRKES
jgi:hypothetical protein